MNIILTKAKIKKIRSIIKTETDRDIYSIYYDGSKICINGDWSIERANISINEDIANAIINYCSKYNIKWEDNKTYSSC